jgi:hypothetical protein
VRTDIDCPVHTECGTTLGPAIIVQTRLRLPGMQSAARNACSSTRRSASETEGCGGRRASHSSRLSSFRQALMRAVARPRDGTSLRGGAPARELLPAVVQAQGEASRGREGHQTLSSAGHTVRMCSGTSETRTSGQAPSAPDVSDSRSHTIACHDPYGTGRTRRTDRQARSCEGPHRIAG